MRGINVSSENKEDIIRFVLSRINLSAPPEDLGKMAALGAYKEEKLIGGFIYANYRKIAGTEGYSIDMHMAGEPGWLTLKSLRAFFAYPFIQLCCSRIVGSVMAGNIAACELALRLGCKQDGCVRSGVSPEYDTIVYTMLRRECRWIKGFNNG